jgi:hypothetical protein
VKNHDFTPKKSYFFQLRREARKFLGYFVWKITILRKKNIFCPILGGARPPLDPPLCTVSSDYNTDVTKTYNNSVSVSYLKPNTMVRVQSANLGWVRFSPSIPVIRYLICVYASHFFAGRPYHFNQTLRTANKF